MLIRFIGPETRRRLWEGYEFSRQTGFVQDVRADVAAGMLTDPGNEFEIDPGEPLLKIKGIGQAMAGELVLAGVGSASELAVLTSAGEKALAKEIGASGKTVAGWVETAAEMVDRGDDQVELEVLDDYKGCCG